MKLNQSECRSSSACTNFARPYLPALEKKTSDRFYDAFDDLTQKVIFKGIISFKKELALFRETSLSLNDPMSKMVEGNILDLLITGTVWNAYSTAIPNESKSKKPLLINVIHFNSLSRSEGNKYEILQGKVTKNESEHESENEISHEKLNRLVGWLKSKAEFRNEADRITIWSQFFESYPKAFFENLFPRIIAFSKWFVQEAKLISGDYALSKSRENNGNLSFNPEIAGASFDQINESLFYLNRIGTTIFNRTEKSTFGNTTYKSVVLPSSLIKKQNCQAMVIDNVRYCGHCTSNCPVSLATRTMNSQGVETIVMEEDNKFFMTLRKYLARNSSAIVIASEASQCLNRAFALKKEGIPAQIIDLDKGKAVGSNETAVNLKRLVKIVQ
jgi:hypothetical protein